MADRDGTDTGLGGDDEWGKHGKCDDRYLCGFADSEPDDDKWQISQRRNRPVKLDRRIEDALDPAVDAHGQAEGDRRAGGDDEGDRYPRQARISVLEQRRIGEAIDGQRHELPQDVDRRGQEQRRHEFKPANEIPEPEQGDSRANTDEKATTYRRVRWPGRRRPTRLAVRQAGFVRR